MNVYSTGWWLPTREDGQIVVDEHYVHGVLISHNEYGDKAVYESKNGTASGANAPTPNNDLRLQICRPSYEYSPVSC